MTKQILNTKFQISKKLKTQNQNPKTDVKS